MKFLVCVADVNAEIGTSSAEQGGICSVKINELPMVVRGGPLAVLPFPKTGRRHSGDGLDSLRPWGPAGS